MPAASGFDHASTTNQIAHAASPPTLAKNARMGHPQAGMVQILKGRPPARPKASGNFSIAGLMPLEELEAHLRTD
jgi:hypothetical protein